MKEHWEFTLLGLILAPLTTGLLSYLVISGPRAIIRRYFPHWIPRTPIYGPADPYRTMGPNARKNVKVCR